MNIRKSFVELFFAVIAGIGALLAWHAYNRAYVVAELVPSSTADDFRRAPKALRSRWLDQMCNDGSCLDPVDYKCGYSFTGVQPRDLGTEAGRESLINGIRERRDCFERLAAKAPSNDTLDKLRILCGRRYMVFIGTGDYKPEDCNQAGGEWGKKRPLFEDESRYFE